MNPKYNEINKNRVLSVLKAVADSDRGLILDIAYGKDIENEPIWSEAEHFLLLKWISEAESKNWDIFSAKQSFKLENNKPLLQLMQARLEKIAKATPHLALLAAVEPLAERY